MNQPTNICPLIGNQCLEDHCAWWDHLAGACCLASGADYLRAVSDSLDELQEKTPASAANADEGKAEIFNGYSASHDTTITEVFQDGKEKGR